MRYLNLNDIGLSSCGFQQDRPSSRTGEMQSSIAIKLAPVDRSNRFPYNRAYSTTGRHVLQLVMWMQFSMPRIGSKLKLKEAKEAIMVYLGRKIDKIYYSIISSIEAENKWTQSGFQGRDLQSACFFLKRDDCCRHRTHPVHQLRYVTIRYVMVREECGGK